jgi:pimeloyl-ACP methyl ester carboxylesterase
MRPALGAPSDASSRQRPRLRTAACVVAVSALVATTVTQSSASAADRSQALTPAAPASVPDLPDGPQRGADVGSVPKVAWAPCPNLPKGSAAFECASYPVPLDYRHPSGKTIKTAMVRLKASDRKHRIGALFLNPGGPGGSGVQEVMDAATASGFKDLNKRFDLIGFDPRGTNASEPKISCWSSQQYRSAFDSTLASPPYPAGIRQALRLGADFDAACVRNSGSVLPFIGTKYTAIDMDRMRAGIGEKQLDFFGLSYGTFLGAVYADMFPSRVRTAVLDGALDPYEYGGEFLTLLRKNYRVSEMALDHFLSWCASAGATKCAFGGGKPQAAFRKLIRKLDAHPAVVDVNGTKVTTTGYGIVFGLYGAFTVGRVLWPLIGQALALAEHGTGPLLNGEFTGINAATGVNPAIECTDSVGGYDVQDFIANAANSRRLAPTFEAALPAGAPAGDGSNGAACVQWPVKNPPSRYRGDYRAEGAAPILVIGTTNDPSTPYEGAVTLSQTLDRAQLLIFVGEGHTAYIKSACIQAKVATYLTSRVLPAVGTGDRCVESPPPSRFTVPEP